MVAHGERTVLRAARAEGGFGDYDRLVLHHGRTALALERSRRHAVSAAELRLAGDLLEDLESDRLDERDVRRRIAAFGLDPVPLVRRARRRPRSRRGRRGAARGGRGRARPARRPLALGHAPRPRRVPARGAPPRRTRSRSARAVAEAAPEARVGVGRPARGRALGRSLLEARAALDAGAGPVSSYRDLGALELLLGLPDAALEAFVDRVLGPAAAGGPLVDSLRALLDAGCRWSEAAATLGVHRHTLRYRMERLRERTGLHPDNPSERMELWLAVKASEALSTRVHAPPTPDQGMGMVWATVPTRVPRFVTIRPVPMTVLIVDDHPELPQQRAGAPRGGGIRGRRRGRERPRRRSSRRARCGPQVVLLDVQLPDIDGFEVASPLTKDEGAPAVVLISSRDGSDFGHLVRDSGARGFIPKAELSGDAIAALV